MIGDDKKFVAALIVPSFKLIENFAKNNNISISKKEDLVKHPKIIELIDVNDRFGLDDVMNASDFGIELAPKFPRFFYDALSMAPDSFDDVSDD